MNHFTLVFVFLIVFLPAFSQETAPDFTVRDSRDAFHRLYTDYLDEDKTVMINFFYTSCVPCNTIAPSLESLYEAWGGGDHDVEFIELSTQAWETDQTVNAFLDKHGIHFPGVSAEGGSLEAIEAFEDEGFGPLFNVPSYAVIAPDGSVNWNVRGFDEEQTIESIDAALAETGASKPLSSISEPSFSDLNFRVSPNPVDDQINVELEVPENGMLSVSIFNILGSRIIDIEVGFVSQGVRQIQHPAGKFRSGTYIIRAELNNTYVRTQRFIKS